MSKVVYDVRDVTVPNKRYRLFAIVVELGNTPLVSEGNGFVSCLTVRNALSCSGDELTLYLGERIYRHLHLNGVIGNLTEGQVVDVMAFTVVKGTSFVTEVLDMRVLTNTEFLQLRDYFFSSQ